MLHATQRGIRTLPRILVLLAVAVGTTTAARAEPEPAPNPAPSAKESKEQAPPGELKLLTPVARQEAQQKLSARRREIATQLADAKKKATAGWLTESLRQEENQLKFMQLILTQQTVLVENEAELKQQLEFDHDDPVQCVLVELKEHPPYTFLHLERLRNLHDDSGARSEVFDLEIETARELLNQSKSEEQRRQRHRRRLRATLQAATNPSEKVKLQRELVVAELGSKVGAELLRLRNLEVDVKQLEREVQTLRLKALDRAIDFVALDARFSEKDLQVMLEQIDEQEWNLQSRLASFQIELSEGQNESAKATPSTQHAIANSRREIIRSAVGQINESLADLVISRYVWKARHRVEIGLASEGEMKELAERLPSFRGHVVNAKKVQELRLRETWLRLTQLESDNKQPNADTSAEIALLRELLDVCETRSVLINQVDRLLSRFYEDLYEQKAASVSLQERFSQLSVALSEWWQYEIVAVDDRPITIGKVITAILMLLGGLFLSRRLSRLIGARMLPRFGVHEGASMAVQTIAFYGMVIVCGLCTLDMLNIPLTVFTFLGGAAAIAVGFGSQNILNNFISGLIILGEQPVRVGDLVEIDGLHANIEHIGPRSTRVRTGSNLEIIVPNSRFLENNVTNWTLSNDTIRACVKVGVAYGSPVADVLTLLRQSVTDEPRALNQPEPIVLFTEFADNSLNFEVHFWVRMQTLMQGRKVESSVRERIDRLFRDAKITIAFPQRDVHLDVNGPIEIALPQTGQSSQSPQLPRRAA